VRIDLRTVDGASGVLAAISDKVTSRRDLNVNLADRGIEELQAHFASRPPNKQGWPSQGFWAKVSGATLRGPVDESSARIDIAEPAINQKIFGGTITPKGGRKYLALPAIAEAYGKSPLVFDFLEPLFSRRQGRVIALIEKEQQGKGWGGRVWYWLVKSVTQRADPQALPPEKAFAAALLDEAKQYLARITV